MGLTKRLLAFDEETFREWVERDRRRKDLESEARQLAAENKLIADDLFVALKENDKIEFVRGQFKGVIKTAKGTVSWKDEFLRVASGEEAAKIAAAVPTKESATIVAIA